MKIGFLPLYIKLYDECLPDLGKQQKEYGQAVANELRKRGFEVIEADTCRIKNEFEAAVANFEQAGCQAIATLHLAYSPSLESADALSKTDLPLVIIDTTPDWTFKGPEQISPNHGIHGVQDFCNLMIRKNKRFLIAAGHWQNSNLLDRTAKQLKSAVMAWQMTHCRIGKVGGDFAGMGDFTFPEGAFNMTVVPYTPQPEPADSEVQAELAQDKKNYLWDKNLKEEQCIPTLKASLKLRHWIEKEKLDAFTICFLGITYAEGWDTVPFLECSKAMARGVGYAGEGDVLTAALSKSVQTAFPETSFTEMFCPDWEGNRLFTSHMGEINVALTAEKPLLKIRDYVFSDTGNPALATGCFKAGKAVLTDLAPGPNGTYTLITKEVSFLQPEGPSSSSNEGWFRPENMDIASFLEAYSRCGGTHHLVASYNADTSILRDFAWLMNWNYAGL